MNKSHFLIVVLLVVACQSPDKVKFERYRVGGERLYLQHCANCHQADGSGFQKLYPPISGNNWMAENFEKTFCLMLNGSNDSLKIGDIQYTLPMPASGLSELEIAQIGTYIYNSWGNDRGLIDVTAVKKILADCEGSDR